MELLRGEELIPQKGKLNLTVHKGPVRRSVLFLPPLCRQWEAKRGGAGGQGHPGAFQSREAAPLHPKHCCGCHGKRESL